MNRWMLVGYLVASVMASCSDGGSSVRDSGPRPDGGGGGDGSAACEEPSFPVAHGPLCFAQPSIDGRRTQCGDMVENCDTTNTRTPSLTCWQSDPPAPGAGPEKATLVGFIDVFSSGPDASSLVVEVYDRRQLQQALVEAANAGQLRPAYFPTVQPIGTDEVSLVWTDKSKPPVDPVRGPARACPKDPKLGLPCTVPAAACGTTQPYCDLSMDQYCHEDRCVDQLRWETRYRIENIPTNTPLAIRVRGDNGFTDGVWGIMIAYDAYLRADAPQCAGGGADNCFNTNGEYELEVNAISRSDYSTIPITAGLSSGIGLGKGAIAGEVHDCQDIKLEGFQVSSRPAPTVMVYFNGNPVKTLPDLARFESGTNMDGIFAALEVEPGPVTVGSVGRVGGAIAGAGAMEIAVLPDSVTVITFDGPDPQ